jgi:DNA-binding NtrC family response regulator
MQDMDGIEVLKVFKKMVPEMAVIMLTGHGSEQAAREGIQFGAFDYLTKPCEFEDLVEKILQAADATSDSPVIIQFDPVKCPFGQPQLTENNQQ